MTKVRASSLSVTDRSPNGWIGGYQVYELVTRTQTERYRGDANPEDFGYVNQLYMVGMHLDLRRMGFRKSSTKKRYSFYSDSAPKSSSYCREENISILLVDAA